MASLHGALTTQICAAYGIPPHLVLGGTADGTAQREAFRRWFTAALLPLAALIQNELRRKLDPAATLDLRGLRALDMQGSARALKSLADAGFTAQQAAGIVGLIDDGGTT